MEGLFDARHLIEWLLGGAAALIFSAAARALPIPAEGGNSGYRFLYNFVQNLLANFDKKVAKPAPSAPPAE